MGLGGNSTSCYAPLPGQVQHAFINFQFSLLAQKAGDFCCEKSKATIFSIEKYMLLVEDL